LKIFYILFFTVCSCVLLEAQKKEYWLIDVETDKKVLVKDSSAAVRFLDSLAQNRYYFTEIKEIREKSGLTEIFFDKGRDYNTAQVELSQEIVGDLKLPRDFYTNNLDSLKTSINEKYRQKGFAFNRVKSQFKGIRDSSPQVALSVIKNTQRKIDKIVLQGYEKVPKRFLKNLQNEFIGKNYEENRLMKMSRSLDGHPFVTLEKPPQTLFTKDSTQVFLSLQKKKSNSFDGIIGFGNDQREKFSFNGSLNVNFQNMFNGFETVNIFWQRNPDKGQTFNLQTDVPYLFGSNVGTNVNVTIFRQDSTYANVKFAPSLYLHLRNHQKLGFRGTFETSTVIDSLYLGGSDYNKQGIGLWYQYSAPTNIALFRHKTNVRVEADFVNVNYNHDNVAANQTQFFFAGEHNLRLSGNHFLNVQAQLASLNSTNDLAVNELLRFGGWNSFRGFNERSFFANLYYFGTAEYRYLVGEQAFFDVFGQYGQFHNKNLGLKPKIYSLGFGFNFFLPVGLMSLQISNGNEFGNPVKFADTKIHWGILSRF